MTPIATTLSELTASKNWPADVLVLHGPNLNLLGTREPDIYGDTTLANITETLSEEASKNKLTVANLQSNDEGVLIDAVHEAIKNTRALMINPAGYSHTSVALRDALALYPHPKMEVHISNVFKREAFRHHSLMSAVVDGVISGCGVQGYSLALNYIAQQLQK